MVKKQNRARRQSITFIVIEGIISPKVTRPRGSITANQLSPNEAASASSLNVSAVSNKNNGKQKKAMFVRVTSKNECGLFFVVGFFIVQNECLLAFLKLRCTFSWFVFVLWKYVFPLWFVLC